MLNFCHTWELFAIFYCCFILVTKDRYLEILVELNLAICDIPESSIFSCTHTSYLTMILPPQEHRPGYRLAYVNTEIANKYI